MLDALVHGTTDPEVLAELAKGRLRAKLPALKEALEGRFDHLHALWIGAILAHIDFLDEQIDRLSDAIEEQIAPFEAAVELLCTIPGVQRRTAEVIIAEIGVDMTRVPDRQAPRRPGPGSAPATTSPPANAAPARRRKGSKWLDWTLEEAALAAIRTKDIYLAAQYAPPASPAAVTRKPSAPSNTRSSAPAGTCSPPASSTTTSAATTSTRRDPERQTKRLVAPARSARTHRHARTNINVNDRGGGRSLNVIFLSELHQHPGRCRAAARTTIRASAPPGSPRRAVSALDLARLDQLAGHRLTALLRDPQAEHQPALSAACRLRFDISAADPPNGLDGRGAEAKKTELPGNH